MKDIIVKKYKRLKKNGNVYKKNVNEKYEKKKNKYEKNVRKKLKMKKGKGINEKKKEEVNNIV
jgi:hypothetical protein